MFFYNLGRNGLMMGSVQEIRYINRDENTHLWLFRNLIRELKKEEPSLFTAPLMKESVLYPGFEKEPPSMSWVSDYADPNLVKTDFFEAKSTAYSKAGAITDDL